MMLLFLESRVYLLFLFFYFILMDPVSVVTIGQQNAVDWLMTKIFQALVNLFFTVIDIVVSFISTPSILWGIAVIAVISLFYRKFRSKIWI